LPSKKFVSPAQILFAEKIALGKGVVIPVEAKTNSAAMALWIDLNKGAKRRKSGRKTAFRPAGSIAPKSTAPTKISRKRKADAAAGASMPAQPNPVAGTPLRIPYGNKEVALKLGARYGSAGWYAPPGVETGPFEERGWL
jgi:DNA topoisomerase III